MAPRETSEETFESWCAAGGEISPTGQKCGMVKASGLGKTTRKKKPPKLRSVCLYIFPRFGPGQGARGVRMQLEEDMRSQSHIKRRRRRIYATTICKWWRLPRWLAQVPDHADHSESTRVWARRALDQRAVMGWRLTESSEPAGGLSRGPFLLHRRGGGPARSGRHVALAGSMGAVAVSSVHRIAATNPTAIF